MQPLEQVLAGWIATAQQREWQLLIAGRFSDPIHRHVVTPIAFEVQPPHLLILLAHRASLSVANPQDVHIEAHGDLVITAGSQARLAWSSEKSMPGETSLCEETYSVSGRFLFFSRTGPEFPTGSLMPYTAHELVRFAGA